jgi:hypothetical protein
MLAIVVSACGRESSLTPVSPTDSVVASLAASPGQARFPGTLLLQRWTIADGRSKSLGFYELQDGWSEPRPARDPGFDTSPITGETLAASNDKKTFVFAPHFLFDTTTGQATALPLPDMPYPEPDYEVYGVAFSPDDHALAYRVLKPYPALFVYQVASSSAARIHYGHCAEYGVTVKVCEQIDDPTWIDSSTVMFAHHEGLPFSFKMGSKDDPTSSSNRLTVMTERGETLVSSDVWITDPYLIVGETAFRARSEFFASAWVDAAELKKGVADWHEFPNEGNDWYYGPALSTISPDGRYILIVADPVWRLVEMRTGHEKTLGTKYQPYMFNGPNVFANKCLWYSDGTQVVCAVQEESYREKLLLIPLSQEPGRIIFEEDEKMMPGDWTLIDWRP